MIICSTLSSITWGKNDEQKIKFQGEWTLEPKFYLDVPERVFWDSTGRCLTEFELRDALSSLLTDASEKGWLIEICPVRGLK